jgi:hypothetical protein
MFAMPTVYFCSGSLLTDLPCGRPAERVRVARQDRSIEHIAYLCLDHRQQACSAGWTISPEPRPYAPTPES